MCCLILVAGVGTYIPYARSSARAGGPSGGSWYGLIYGIIGSAMMLFAMLLGLKKRVRTLRIGRAYYWLQGHVWLGLLAYPIILLHSGFRWGGMYTEILMWMFTIVVISGIIGIVIQQYMPSKILHEVKFETIYEQVDHVVFQLHEEAEELVRTAIGESGGEAFEMEVVPAGGTTATLQEKNLVGARTFTDFYVTHVKPYLGRTIPAGTKLKTEAAAKVAFEQVRAVLPSSMQEPLTDLAAIVEERRQLANQKRMHHILHGWLIVHVPLSYGLMLLAAWHAFEALQYKRPW